MEVQMNELGLIKIPRELCDKLGLESGSEVEICCDYKHILIKAHNPACPLCGNSLEDVLSKLCKSCKKNIIDTYQKETK